MTDEELAALAKSGDVRAFDDLSARYKSVVLTCARSFFLSGGGRDDLVQEGMIGLYRAVLKYDPSKNISFKSFAVVCIKRNIIDAVRRDNAGKNYVLNSSVSLDDEPALVSPPSSNPENLLIGAEAVSELMRRSERLSKLERVILKKYLEGKTYFEIAKEIDSTQKSVDNAVQRIRKKMQ
jgi:RNA polymerase sporulation-specific sigma factor